MRGDTRSYAAARKERAADIDRWLTDLLRTACGTPYGRRGTADADERGALTGSRSSRWAAWGAASSRRAAIWTWSCCTTAATTWRSIADRIWYPIWDSGVGLDHSVRTVDEAAKVAREDLKAVLGLIQARHVAGDPELTRSAREIVLAEWRADSRRRLGELREAAGQAGGGERRAGVPARTRSQGLARRDPRRAGDAGGRRGLGRLRPGPAGPRGVRAAARHPARAAPGDRARRRPAGAPGAGRGRRDAGPARRRGADAQARRGRPDDRPRLRRHLAHRRPAAAGPAPRGRRPLADGVVEHGGEVVLARGVDPRKDPVLVLRAAAAAAEAGLPLAPATVTALAAQSPAAARALARRGA